MAFILTVSSEVLAKFGKTVIMLLLRFKLINMTFLSVNISQILNMSKKLSLQIGFLFLFHKITNVITYFEIKKLLLINIGSENLTKSHDVVIRTSTLIIS